MSGQRTDIATPGYWLRLSGRAFARSWGRDVMLYTGGVSFFALLAVFPAIAILIGFYKAVLSIGQVSEQAAALADVMPHAARTIFQAEVERLKAILKQQRREIPDAYLCPITMDPMEDPVMAADGHSYERREIEAWLDRGKRMSPMTGAPLPHTHLMPNHALKKAIQDFLEEVRKFAEF